MKKANKQQNNNQNPLKYRELEHMQRRIKRIKNSIGNIDYYLNQQLNDRFNSLYQQNKINQRDLEYLGARLISDENGQAFVSFDHLFDPTQVNGFNTSYVMQALQLSSDNRIKFWKSFNDIINDQYLINQGLKTNNPYQENASYLIKDLEKSFKNQDRLLKDFIQKQNPSHFFDNLVKTEIGQKYVQINGLVLSSVLVNGRDENQMAKIIDQLEKSSNNLVANQKPLLKQWTNDVLQHWLLSKTDYHQSSAPTNFQAYFGKIFQQAQIHLNKINQLLSDHRQGHTNPISQAEITLLKMANPYSALIEHFKTRLMESVSGANNRHLAILNTNDVDQWLELLTSDQKWLDGFCRVSFLDQNYLDHLSKRTTLDYRFAKSGDRVIEFLIEDPQEDDLSDLTLNQLNIKANKFSLFYDPQQKLWNGAGVQPETIRAIELLDPEQATPVFSDLKPHQRVVRISFNKSKLSQAQFKNMIATFNASFVKDQNQIEPYQLNDLYKTDAKRKVGTLKSPLHQAISNLKITQPHAKVYDFHQAFIKVQNDLNHHIVPQIKQTITYASHPELMDQHWVSTKTHIKSPNISQSFLPTAITLSTVGKHLDSKLVKNLDPIHYDNYLIKALNVYDLLKTHVDFNDPNLNWFSQSDQVKRLKKQLDLLGEDVKMTNDPVLKDHYQRQLALWNYYQNDLVQPFENFNLKQYLTTAATINDKIEPTNGIRRALKQMFGQIKTVCAQKDQVLNLTNPAHQIIASTFDHYLLNLLNDWYLIETMKDEALDMKLMNRFQDDVNFLTNWWKNQDPALTKTPLYQAPLDLWTPTIIKYHAKNNQAQVRRLENEVELAKATVDHDAPLAAHLQPQSDHFAMSLVHAHQIANLPNPTGSLRLQHQQELARAYLDQYCPSQQLMANIYQNQIVNNRINNIYDYPILKRIILEQLNDNFHDPELVNRYQTIDFNPQSEPHLDLDDQAFWQQYWSRQNQTQQTYSFRFGNQDAKWQERKLENRPNWLWRFKKDTSKWTSQQLENNYFDLFRQMLAFWTTYVDQDEVVKIASLLKLDPKIKHQLDLYQQAKLTHQDYQLDPEVLNAINQDLVKNLLMDPYNPHAMQNIINLIQGGSDYQNWYKRDGAGQYQRINPTTIMIDGKPVNINVKDCLEDHYSKSRHQELMLQNQITFGRFGHFFEQLQQHQDVGLKHYQALEEKYNNRAKFQYAWSRQRSALGLSLVAGALAIRSNRNAQIGALLTGPLGVIALMLLPLAASALDRLWGWTSAQVVLAWGRHQLAKTKNQYFLTDKLKAATFNDLYPHSQKPHLEIDPLRYYQAQKATAANQPFMPWQGEKVNNNYQFYQNMKTTKAAQDLMNFSHNHDLEQFNNILKQQNVDLFALFNQSENVVGGYRSARTIAYEELNQKLTNLAKTSQPFIIKNSQNRVVINPVKSPNSFKMLPPEVFRSQAALERYHQFLSGQYQGEISFHEIFKTTTVDPEGNWIDNRTALYQQLAQFGFGPPDQDPDTIDQWKTLFINVDQARALFYQNQPWDHHCLTTVKDYNNHDVVDPQTLQKMQRLSPTALRNFIENELIFDHEIKAFQGATTTKNDQFQVHKFFDEKYYYQQGLKNYQALEQSLINIGAPQNIINQISNKVKVFANKASAFMQIDDFGKTLNQDQFSGLNFYLKTFNANKEFINYYFDNYVINDFETKISQINQQLEDQPVDRAAQQQVYDRLKSEQQDLISGYQKSRNEIKNQFLNQFAAADLSANQELQDVLLYEHESIINIKDPDGANYQSQIENHSTVDDSKMATLAKIAWLKRQSDHHLKNPVLSQQQDLVLKYLDFISNHQPKIKMNEATWNHFLLNEKMYQEALLNGRITYRDQDWLKYDKSASAQNPIRDSKFQKELLNQKAKINEKHPDFEKTIYSDPANNFAKFVDLAKAVKPTPVDFAFDKNHRIKFSFNQMQMMLVDVFNDQNVQHYLNLKIDGPSIHQQYQWSEIKKQEFDYRKSQAFQNEIDLKKRQQYQFQPEGVDPANIFNWDDDDEFPNHANQQPNVDPDPTKKINNLPTIKF